MPYPAAFHRLVMIGTIYEDIFNVTLSMTPIGAGAVGAVSQSLLDNVAAAVGTWWPKTLGANLGISICGSAKLTSIKLNRISTAGLYADPTAMTKVYASPILGGSNGGYVPQLSVVASLRGNQPRNKAGRGRMYFPVSEAANNNLDTSTGQIATTTATNHANGVRALLGILNDVYLTAGVPAVAGIASNAGAGAFQGVNAVAVGRVVDTMRSRRNKDREAPVTVTM